MWVETKTQNPNLYGSDLRILVDLKGIEPSNLTDANRALSQLSYRPIPADGFYIIANFSEM